MSCEQGRSSIGDICQKVITGGTPSTKNPEYYSNGKIPWLRTGEVLNGNIYATEKHITTLGIDNSSAKLVPVNSVIVAMYGQGDTAGRVAINKIDLTTNQACCSLVINPTLADYRYVFYQLKLNYSNLVSLKSGSAQPNLNTRIIKEFEIPLPDIGIQNAIAATLSCLDDKIELNNRMNKTLEEMAQAIFKSWFVDFEPFQDGEFVDSELGRIPKGWRVGTLGELVETSKAGDWGKDNKEGNYSEQVLCIRGADIPEIQNGERGKMVCRYIIPKNLTKRLSANSIVVEISGGSPTQSTGRIAFITHEFLSRFPMPVICTNFCKALGISTYYGEYVYFRWQMLYMDGILFNYENGTTGIKNFDINNFLAKHLVVLPPVDVVKTFSSITADLMQLIVSNGMQNAAIRMIRDSLLPKLMSGEIPVPSEV